MPENTDGTDALRLREDFPPVSTTDWEAAIRKDLKGADYDKKLLWRTDEGVIVRPYYRAEDLTGLGVPTGTVPGEFPFVRGNGGRWEIAQEEAPPEDAIRADRFHEAGATVVQELGFAIAAGVESLAQRTSGGATVDTAASGIDFVFAVGSTFFFEIAKLRAARWLWAQAVSAFQPKDDAACLMRIHVRTSRLNKSLYDGYTNMLRATTEAMAAAIGGCERLTVEPFGFDSQLAVNIQRILREEAHLDAVADPAGGSYFVEALTDVLAREGWKLFQQVEAEGGYARALESGSIAEALTATRSARQKAVSSRRRTLVGVNNYPDLVEKIPETATAPDDPDTPFPQTRLAEPFEQIRMRTVRHAQRTGHTPQVLLLKRGDPKMSMARTNFALNFFGCAGFEIVQSEDYATWTPDLIVLCSSDAEYLALAQEVCRKVSVPVLVAGNPKDALESLQAAGVQGFVHVLSDAVETLAYWQDRLGMEP